MGHYLGAAYFGEYASEGMLPVNPWIHQGCGEATGDCRPPSLLDDLWPECGDCRPPSVLPTPQPELVSIGRVRATAGSVFGGL